jgi:hypothetical protein
MTVRDATRSLLTMPLGDAAEERVLSLVIDQDILEVTVSGAAGIAVIRIPPLDGTILRSQSRTGDGIHAVRIAALSAQVSQR